MSWPQWQGAMQPGVSAVPVINPAPAVLNPTTLPIGVQYTPEQWQQMQQQNWQQWAQWQQQYQQWHQQYGAEYQKTLSAMANTTAAPAPPIPMTTAPPPLPQETKPPLPPEEPPTSQPLPTTQTPTNQPSAGSTHQPSAASTHQPSAASTHQPPNKPPNFQSYTSAPPPSQPTVPSYSTAADHNPYIKNQNQGVKAPLWKGQPNMSNPPPNMIAQKPEQQNHDLGVKRPLGNQADFHDPKRNKFEHNWQNNQASNQPPPQASSNEELSEGEKKFMKQFAEWEAQFNKWKEQNQDHPDKTQYKEYEKKWEAWRNQLLERREQMRRRRLGMNAAGDNKSVAKPVTPVGVPPVNMNKPPPCITSTAPPINQKPPLISQKPPPIAQKPPPTYQFPEETVTEGNSFLKSNNSGGIPGLDLVEEAPEKDHTNEEVIDLEKSEVQAKQKGPDLEALSKNINSILGDTKLLSMLNLVTQNQSLNVGSKSSESTPSLAQAEHTSEHASNLDDMSTSSFNQDADSRSQFGKDNWSGENFERANNNDRSNDGLFNKNEMPPEIRGPDGKMAMANQLNSGYGNLQQGNNPSIRNINQGFNRDYPIENDGFDRNFNEPGRSSFGREGNSGRDHFGRRTSGEFGNNRFPPGDGDFGNSRGPMGDFGNNRGLPGVNFPHNKGPGGDFAINRGPSASEFGNNRGSLGDFNNKVPSADFGNNRGPGGGDFGNNRGSQGGTRGNDFDNERGPGSDYDIKGLGGDFAGGRVPPVGDFGNIRGPGSNFGSNRGPVSDFENNIRGGDFGNRVGMDNFGNRGGHGNDFDLPGRTEFGNRIAPLGRGSDFSNNRGSLGRGDFGNHNFRDDYNRGGGGNFDRDFYNRGHQDYDNEENFGGGGDYNKSDNFDYNRGPDRFDNFKRDGFNRGSFESEQRGSNFNRPPPKDFRQETDLKQDFINDSEEKDKSGPIWEDPPKDFEEVEPNIPEETSNIEEILAIEKVIDYDHKSRKQTTFDVSVVPPHSFDYRHKPVNRIPLPDRPKWLMDTFRILPEFEPAIGRPAMLLPHMRYTPVERFDYRSGPNYDTRYNDYATYNRRPRDDRKYDGERRHHDEERRENRYENERRGPEERYDNDRREDRYEDERRCPESRYDIEKRGTENRFENERKGLNDRYTTDRKGPIDKYESDRKGLSDRYEVDRKGPIDKYESDRKGLSDRYEVDRKGPNDRYQNDRKGFNDRYEGNRKGTNDRFDGERRGLDDDYNRSRRSDYRNNDYDNKRNNNSETSLESKQQLNKNVVHKTITNTVLIDDILNPPGRFKRPSRIVIILRGPPGSGKTFLAKLIKDKEVENGGSAPRILSLDDYFMVEQEKDLIEDGKKIVIKEMVYEYEECMESSYRTSLLKSFKKNITDGYFPFIIVDNVNDKTKYFSEMWSFAKQNGFEVYVCQLELDAQICSKRNVHNRTESEIETIVSGWEPTPSHYTILDATNLIQAGSIPEVEMEEINSPNENFEDEEESEEQACSRSKWDNFECSINNLAKLDGISKPLRSAETMEDYLQLDEWKEPVAKPGQKRVRWADLEERREQEKMRAIGFVVGQTDWGRMMDPTQGGSALTKTKYIERVRNY